MGNERERILRMVAEGDLTVEQAERLLAALEERTRPAAPAQVPAPEPSRAAPGHRPPAFAPMPPTPPVPPMPPIPPIVFGGRRARAVRRISKQKLRKNPAFDHLIQLAIHDISPSYVRELREAGLMDLTIDQVVQLGIHDVKPGFVREMREAGFADELTFDEMIQLAIHDIKPEYVRSFREAGLEDLDLDQVVQAAIHGLDPEKIKEWKEAGIDPNEFASKRSDDDPRRAMREAMREARDAAREALNDARDAMRDAAEQARGSMMEAASEMTPQPDDDDEAER